MDALTTAPLFAQIFPRRVQFVPALPQVLLDLGDLLQVLADFAAVASDLPSPGTFADVIAQLGAISL
jgi:hypothetical protein